MKYLLLLLIFLQSGYIQAQRKPKLDPNNALFHQYSFLLEKSLKYDHQNNDFKYDVAKFIDTCTWYVSYLEKRISPFDSTTPIQLKPYLFNSDQTQVILMVLHREEDRNGDPVDYVSFILGSYNNITWVFRLKEGYVRSFGYEGNHPMLSDTEMTIRILRTLIDSGYMPPDEVKINDKFFKDDRW